MTNIFVSELYHYPIKSCAGIAIEQATLNVRGIAHDRRFMVVDDAGLCLTQRDHPKLALVHAEVVGPLLRLTAPDMPELNVEIQTEGPTNGVVVWGDACQAVEQNDETATWLSRYLHTSVHLVRMADNFARPIEPGYGIAPTDQVSFADAFPYLLASEASLADVNSHLDQPLPMNRFRPNIVIQGSEAFDEDQWQRIQIGNASFAVSKPCARCTVTTIDQATGEKGIEPLPTLAKYRELPGWKGVMFGQNLILLEGDTIGVGDRVEIIR